MQATCMRFPYCSSLTHCHINRPITLHCRHPRAAVRHDQQAGNCGPAAAEMHLGVQEDACTPRTPAWMGCPQEGVMYPCAMQCSARSSTSRRHRAIRKRHVQKTKQKKNWVGVVRPRWEKIGLCKRNPDCNPSGQSIYRSITRTGNRKIHSLKKKSFYNKKRSLRIREKKFEISHCSLC